MHQGSTFVDLIEKNTMMQADLKSDKPNDSYYIFSPNTIKAGPRLVASINFLK